MANLKKLSSFQSDSFPSTCQFHNQWRIVVISDFLAACFYHGNHSLAVLLLSRRRHLVALVGSHGVLAEATAHLPMVSRVTVVTAVAHPTDPACLALVKPHLAQLQSFLSHLVNLGGITHNIVFYFEWILTQFENSVLTRLVVRKRLSSPVHIYFCKMELLLYFI